MRLKNIPGVGGIREEEEDEDEDDDEEE